MKKTELEFDEYPWIDLCFVSKMQEKDSTKKLKERMTCAAFTAWLMGVDSKKTFEQFLRHYGLIEKEKPASKDATKIAINKAKSIAERIMAMDRKRKPRKK